MESNYTLSDIAAVTDGGMGGMGGSWVAWILLFALFGGGFGFGGRGQAATTEDLASGFNFSALQGKTNDILAAVNGVNQNLGNAICSSTYELASKIDNCCCTTQRAVDSVKYDMANFAAATNAHVTEQTQKVLDALTGNRMADMQNQINQLQLQAAMCGVVRYPTATTYSTPCNPFFGYSGCGCNGAF